MNADKNKSLKQAIAGISHEETDLTVWFDFLGDQKAVEDIGYAIADAVADLAIDAVLTWLDPDATVLGYLVASRLNVVRGAIYEDLGLLKITPEALRNLRVLVIDTHVAKFRGQDVVKNLIEGAGNTFVAGAHLSISEGIVIERYPA